MLTKTLKLPAKIVTGYNGTDDQLAMRRGEITGIDRLALFLGAVREERLWPFHRADRRQRRKTCRSLPLGDRPAPRHWSRWCSARAISRG